MGVKLMWTGLTLMMVSTVWAFLPAMAMVGAVLMVLGCLLNWLDK